MKALALEETRPAEEQPLRLAEIAEPVPGPSQVRIRIGACGVCHTDLHVVEAELPSKRMSLVPGHEIAVICMTPIPQMDCDKHLYHEKTVRSFANSSCEDAEEILRLAAEIPIRTEVRGFDLDEANHVLMLVKQGAVQGAGVLRIPAQPGL